MASIFGNYKYKEYKYHQTYEYKLLNHGYKGEDVTKILNNFSEKDYNYFLNNDVNENYIKLLDEKYFLKKKTAGDWKSAVFLLYWKTVTTRWSQQDSHGSRRTSKKGE